MEPFYRAILEHLDKHPSIIASPFHNVAARMAREKTGARLVTVHLQPSCFLSAHDMPVFVNGAAWMKKLPLWCRRLLFALPNPMSFHLARLLRPLCKTEDITMPRRMLPDWMHSPDANLALFPDWFAAPQPDWPENVIQAGFPLEDLSGQFVLPSDVDEFLAQGDKPVLLSPGTGNSQAREFFKAGLAACERLGCRALLGTKFKEQLPSPLPSWARHFEYLPFSELLPRVSVLVHHGGIGTMSQALAAGVPQLVMPMAHDQPDNADRVKRLGAGEWLAPSKFNKERVAEQLRDLMTNNKVAAACAMSAQCCHESRATELAMKLLESM